MDTHGLITIESQFSVGETIDRLAAKAASLGLETFARVDHAAGASRVGMALRPTELLIFGNPKGGTPLMQDRQTIGIDLPIRAVAWEDENGQVWLTTNDASWLAERHGLAQGTTVAVKAIADGTAALARFAAGHPT